MRINRQLIVSILLVLIGVLLVGGAIYWFQAGSKPGEIQQEEIQGESPFPEIPRVSLSDAKAAFELKNAVFIDVRGADSFAQGHIPGALSIPVDDLPEKLNDLNPATWYILYCT